MEVKPSTVCRLCLDVVPVGYTILKENIQNIIEILTSIDVTDNDNLPKLSCSKCIFNLYFVENIRNLIIKSDEKLHALVDKDGNWEELLKCKPPLELEDENHSKFDVDVKEEKFSPVNETEDVFNEECDKSEETEDVPDDAGIGDIFEEDDIKNIIFKKTNTKPYLYHCKVCKVDFKGNKMYARHKGKHTKKTCEICGVTTRQDNFYKHMTKHKLGQQICDICGSVHKSLEGLRTHLFHFHNAKKKMYTCEECGESFKYSHRLTYHKRKIHTGFRPHQCDSCGKKFFDLGTMKKHVKLIHLKLREYHCKYCQKDYSSSYALKVHTRQHTDETPYICEICSEGFRQLVSLKTHLAKHQRELNKKDPKRKKSESQVKDEITEEDIFK